ncbi:Tryptophan synthase alpha chain [Minicystis rosea]|nr:Tryptophan synthase alpha chain [Minicystis rosea]
MSCSAKNSQFNTGGGNTGGSGGAAGTGGGLFTSSSSSSSGDVDGGFHLDAGPDAPTCTTPVTCQDVGANCGPIGDGCGGVIDCGTCTAPDTCGGGGTPSVCGSKPCVAKTCSQLGANCGPVADGCGGVVMCGTCTAPDICGGGDKPSVCGHTSTCTPFTCAQLGVNCGMQGDGCGNLIDCGTCTAPESCGGGGFPGVCGTPPCVPLSCADLGSNCGIQGDGCGGVVTCGVCVGGQTCGGAGQPGVCGTPNTCTNLCLKQVTCADPNVTTTVTGTVYAPNGTDPLLNALVYVPNAPVQPFAAGVACETCGAKASGSPLVSAVSGVDGKFTLKNVPVGTNIPVVIQLGRWRRQITIPNVVACQNNVLPAAQTRLPKNKTEGDIPLIAFATGSLDALECVFRQIGVDDSEFTSGTGNGRIHLYTGKGSSGATISGAQDETALTDNLAVLNRYDMVFFPCQGGNYTKNNVALSNLLTYANAGGRIFSTHYGYGWMYQNGAFAGAANWNVDNYPDSIQTGYIDTSFPKGQALAQWLMNVGASTTLGQIPLQEIRQDTNSVIAPTQTWMTVNSPQFPVHFTFNTPVGAPAAQQCGRVLFDDFHVFSSSSGTFPAECASSTTATPQAKLLEFMIFDLGSCVTPDVPVCTPKTCAELGANCGLAGDGCGGAISCGTCTAPQTCGGGGVPSQCGSSCHAKTCQQLDIECGPAGDGCGGVIQCGSCPAGQTCGGGGMPGVCGNQACTPKSCAQQGIGCGPAGDGCGNLIQCGSCTAPQTCGGGGVAGVCGAPVCTPKTCAQLGATCGPLADGCGGILQCGTCQIPQTCGGGGTPNVCGGSGPG